jgi:hypothetical protein
MNEDLVNYTSISLLLLRSVLTLIIATDYRAVATFGCEHQGRLLAEKVGQVEGPGESTGGGWLGRCVGHVFNQGVLRGVHACILGVEVDEGVGEDAGMLA